MRVKCTLVVNAGGGVRVMKRHPMRVEWDEVAIPLTIELSDRWFTHSASVVQIDVPDPRRGDIQVEPGEVELDAVDAKAARLLAPLDESATQP